MVPCGPFGDRPRVAAGVSGGPHSLALALLAHDWAAARGGDLLALVVDHGLRPGSGAEAAGVAALLAARGIAARVLPLALAPGSAQQERARAARLAALLAACGAAGRPWLLLGHHRGDQAETVLFRALRGSGPAGLAGMAAVAVRPEALLLRPLLEVAPARLETVMAAAGLVPVRDPANADPRFVRTRLRAALADPAGDGAATLALVDAARAFARRARAADAAVAERLAAAVEWCPEGFARLDLPALGADAVAALALARLARVVAGAAHAPSAAAAAALLARGHGTLGGALLARGEGGDGRRLLAREPAAVAPPVPAVDGAGWDGRFRLRLARGTERPAGEVLGALGRAPGGPGGRACGGLPAVVRAGLPALLRAGAPPVVPHLGWPDATACAGVALAFHPGGGAAT